MPRPGRKEQILAAAAALFSDKGYHATTIRDIAQESGMLSGSLYAHISSKEDLLYEIIARAAEQFIGSVEPLVAGPESAEAKLRQALRSHVRVVAHSMDGARVFLHEWKALDPARREEIRRKRDQYEALWDRILQEGMASGEFRPVDLKFARLLVLSAANWVYHWYDPGGPLGPDEVADRFSELILHGLRHPDRTTGPGEPENACTGDGKGDGRT